MFVILQGLKSPLLVTQGYGVAAPEPPSGVAPRHARATITLLQARARATVERQ